MENASKALLIAGGVLIALLILGALVMLFANLQNYQYNKNNMAKDQQIAKFNGQFEPFNKEKLTAMELKSIYNKIISNNREAEEDGREQDIIKFNGEAVDDTHNTKIKELLGTIEIAISGGAPMTFSEDDINNFLDNDKFKELNDQWKQMKVFCKCDGIEYDDKTGRINNMKFSKVP